MDDDKNQTSLATLGGLTAFLGGSGFLAARSYFHVLNLPEHINVSWESYAQYGGRFWFTALIHAVVIGGCALILLAAAVLLDRLRTRLTRASAAIERVSDRLEMLGANLYAQGSVVIAIAIAALASELWLISLSGVSFEREHVRLYHIPDAAIVALEAAMYVTAWWLYSNRRTWWVPARRGRTARALLFGLPLLLWVGTLGFFPALFGRTLMVPQSFDRVTVTREKADAISGLLVFGTDDWVFVSVEGRLVEVRRESVEAISYDARQTIETVP